MLLLMNSLPKDIIISCLKFLTISEIKILRECCTNTSNITRRLLFKHTIINLSELKANNINKLADFINIHDLIVNIKNFRNKNRKLINKINNKNNIQKLIFYDNTEKNNLNIVATLSCLKILILSKKFNSKIKSNVLPSTLEILELGPSFNQEINLETLPKKLKVLKFGFYFNKKIKPKTLPEELEELYFGNTYSQIVTKDIFPPKL
jgi:hypothetical protein